MMGFELQAADGARAEEAEGRNLLGVARRGRIFYSYPIFYNKIMFL